MAVQQSSSSYDLFSIFRSSPFIQQKVLGRHLLPNGQWTSSSSSSTSLADLDDYCFANIFRCLPLRDLVRLRRVCRRLHFSVGEYLDTRRHFVYSCAENGVALDGNGHYRFNLAAFDFALAHMPNLRSLAFERCSVMKLTMATCNQDLLERLTSSLYDLKMLALPRSLAVTPKAVDRLLAVFPELTHLTVTLFNEEMLGAIIDGLRHLKYLNLAESLLYDYAPVLRRLPPTIRTFIAPVDAKEGKGAMLEALCLGNGRKLERLEVRITIHDLAADSEWFARLGAELRRLKWFQAELASPQKRITNAVTSSSTSKRSSASDVQGVTRTRTRASTFAAFSSTTTSTPILPPPPSPHKKTTLERPKIPPHHHHHLLRGLSGLRSLRVLVLKETDYFDGDDRVRSGLYTSPLLDDHSLLEIFRACSHLEALTLATALRRNGPDYHRCEFESRENAAEVNRVLSAIFAEDQLVDQIVPKTGTQTRRQSLLLASTSSSFSASFDNGVSGSRNRALSRKLAKRPPFTRSVSIFGDMFEEGGRQNHSSNSTAEDGSASNEDDDSSDDCNSEGQTSLDSGVGVDLGGGGGGGGQQDHSSSSSSSSSAVTDCCLATLHQHLPRLRLLQLRGVRLGRPSMDAIASLSRLELLRLDSISFAEEEARDFFTEFISRLTAEGGGGGDGGDGGPNKTNIRITNIPLV